MTKSLALKGRGAVSNPDCRFHDTVREHVDDGWHQSEPSEQSLRTKIHIDKSKTIITQNKSPDVPFERSMNPYRGCEHGCIYCFARPSHAYLDLSPGLDFESQLVIKPDAPDLLRIKLASKSYRCQVIAMGTNTDPYQPIERRYKITRGILEVLNECNHPVSIVTKSSLIERDMDILAEMASRNLVSVMMSVCTLDKALARSLEPRACTPQRRIKTIQRLTEQGIPTGVLVAPIMPVLNDTEIESVLAQCAAAGAQSSGFILLRLPLEVAPLFREWLEHHYPLKAAHVLKRIRDTRGGKLYQAEFGARMTGQGAYAAMIDRRFSASCRRFGIRLNRKTLDKSAFVPPKMCNSQLSLF